jgi:1,4-alpha-glucan branching enzyme
MVVVPSSSFFMMPPAVHPGTTFSGVVRDRRETWEAVRPSWGMHGCVRDWIDRNYDRIVKGDTQTALAEVTHPEAFAEAGAEPLRAAFGWRAAIPLFNSMVPEGANVMGGKTVFRIWSPDSVRVDLMVKRKDGVDLRELKRDSLGNHIGVFDDLPAGTDYMYRVTYPGGWFENLPDPFSRCQSCPVGRIDGWSRVVDLRKFDWGEHRHLHRSFTDLRVYEMHTGLMTERGTFNALLEGTDWEYLTGYLRDKLHINAVEIMPVHEGPGDFNWGYDVVLPFGVFRSYGTPGELQNLVKRLHEAGISVIFDVVMNHLAKVRLYNGQWATHFGYFADRNADGTTPWGPALRMIDGEPRADKCLGVLQNLALAVHLIQMYVHDFGADGIRFDMTPYVADETGWAHRRANNAALRFLRDAMRAVDPDAVFIAEDFRLKDGDLTLKAETGIEHSWNMALSDALFDMLLPGRDKMRWHVRMDDLFNAAMFGTFRRFAPGEEIPPPLMNYFVSHDERGNYEKEPVPILRDRERAMMGYAISAMARGAVMLFMGDEYGAGTTPMDGDFFRPGEDRRAEAFHFFARYPVFVAGDYSVTRGYASVADQDAKEPQRFASMKLLKLESPAWDEGVFLLWRDLMALRTDSAALRSEDVSHREPLYVHNDHGVLVFMRQAESDVVIVGVNMSDVDYQGDSDGDPRVRIPEGTYSVAVNTQDAKYGGHHNIRGELGAASSGDGFASVAMPLPPRSVVVLRRSRERNEG